MAHSPILSPSAIFLVTRFVRGFLRPRVRRAFPVVVACGLAVPGSSAAMAQQPTSDSPSTADTVVAEPPTTPAAEPMERARASPAIDRVDLPRDVERTATETLTEMLDGRIPGLTITESSGEVGASNFIRLRGPVSIGGQEPPIVYVDGVRATARTSNPDLRSEYSADLRGTSRLDDIDPRDVASLQVLKGPAAAALYGGDADAGVLLVETRRGEGAGPRITVSTEQGLTRRVGSYLDDYIDLTESAGITDPDLPELEAWRPVRNPVTGHVFARFNPLEDASTSPFREGRVRGYGVTGHGAAGALGYYVSVRRDADDGVLPSDRLRRTRLRSNLDLRLLPSLELSASASYLESEGEMPVGNGSRLGMLINGGYGRPLTSYGSGPRAGESCLREVLVGDDGGCADREGNYLARFGILAEIADREEVDRFTGGFSARWRPAEWLSGRFTAGVDRADTEILRVVRPQTVPDSRGEASMDVIEDRTYTADLVFTASRDLNERISSTTTLGASYVEESLSLLNRASAAFPVEARGDEVFESAVASSSVEVEREHDQEALFLQQRLGYSDLLFVDLGARVDDVADRAGELNPVWAPTAGVSLVPSRLDSWAVDFVGDLRLRAAWGRATRVFPHDLSGVFAPAPGLSPGSANPEPEHERTSELEVGLDASLLDGRLAAALTHFRRTTTGSPIVTGFSLDTRISFVEMENRGFEALVEGRLLESESFAWDATLTLATRSPEVTDMNGAPPARAPGSSFGNTAPFGQIMEGYAPGALFGYRVASAERDADGRIVPGSVVLEEGDLSFGAKHLGDPHPTSEQSLATSLRLFDALLLRTRFDRAAGHVKMDGTSWLDDLGGRRWAFREAESTPEEQAALEGATTRRSLYVHDAEFVKWRVLTLAWDLPRSWMDRSLGLLADVRLTLGGRNLHTWTGYPGTDPEARSAGGAIDFSSYDYFGLPPLRSWFVRLSVSF